MTRSLLVACALVASGCYASHGRGEGTDDEPGFASSASLAIDGASLYWIDGARGAVMRAPRGGGPEERLAAADPDGYAFVAINRTHVFWADFAEGIVFRSVSIDGGSAARVAGGDGGPVGIAADEDALYFSRSSGTFDLIERGLADGSERVVAPDHIALGIALDGPDLFATSCNAEGVWRVPRAGGPSRALATETFCPIALALHGEHVYFTDSEESGMEGGVYAVSREGGPTRRVTPSDQLGFAVDAGFVYAIVDGSIVRAPVDGGPSVELARAPTARAVAVDPDLVYWIESEEDGSLALRYGGR